MKAPVSGNTGKELSKAILPRRCTHQSIALLPDVRGGRCNICDALLDEYDLETMVTFANLPKGLQA